VTAVQVDLRLGPFDAPWPDVRDTVHAAVDAGFAGIWTPGHVVGRVFGANRVLECWTAPTAVAVSTADVVVGPSRRCGARGRRRVSCRPIRRRRS
jgi:alkanesulfonate monooxygenase SsuD/methylene tetrahydromethanopterin reductase-like flavin-dependent oxidoreductase (luciferase family)